MPSPFPGMDPFIEGQRWQDFHSTFIAVLKELLVPVVRPKYSVDVEQDVYLVSEGEIPAGTIEPDLAFVEASADIGQASDGAIATAAALAPAVYTLSIPQGRRQKYLTIRDREDRMVVTVIELLSPTNKSPAGGYMEYQGKRENVLNTRTNLVELDLLRGGRRSPTRERLPAAEYYAFICRAPTCRKLTSTHGPCGSRCRSSPFRWRAARRRFRSICRTRSRRPTIARVTTTFSITAVRPNRRWMTPWPLGQRPSCKTKA